MDSYAVKFQSLQHYVPFLNRMIGKLEKAGDRDKEAQLVKMKSLHAILTDPNKKVRFETLLKCEEVLQKLYEKVEGPADQQRSRPLDQQRGGYRAPSVAAGEGGRGGVLAASGRGGGQQGRGDNSAGGSFNSTSSIRDTVIQQHRKKISHCVAYVTFFIQNTSFMNNE